jgi:hypothetical protein
VEDSGALSQPATPSAAAIATIIGSFFMSMWLVCFLMFLVELDREH